MNKYKKDCVFCKVAKREIEHNQFWEDNDYIAFLDKNPVSFGHTLIIPKRHVSYVFSLNENEYINLLKVTEKVAKAIQKITNCKRVCMGIYGFEIDHTHVHLFPLNNLKEFKHKIKKPTSLKQKIMAQKLSDLLN